MTVEKLHEIISNPETRKREDTQYLTDKDIFPRILKLITSARYELLLVSPWIYHPEICDLLIQKSSQGVLVKLISRPFKANDNNKHLQTIEQLDENGIQIAFIDTIHNKIIIKDAEELIQSSKNLTQTRSSPIDGGIWSNIPSVVEQARNDFFSVYKRRFKS